MFTGRRTDAAHKAANKVNKGLDKAQEKQQEAYENASGKEDVTEEGQKALDSAKDAAIHTKYAPSIGLIPACGNRPQLLIAFCSCILRS